MHSIDLRSVPISDVFESAFNTRTHFDADKMRDLEASIREVGVLTPLIVRPVGERYELAAGHRRLRAALAAGVETVPVSVRALTDLQLREVITIENLQREDIHPLDEAEGYRSILKADKSYTVAIVAAKVGKSESYVYRRLKLLELEPNLRTALSEDRLSVAHAEKLLRLPPALRKEAADPAGGVVWRASPLLSYAEDWTPQREDLRPLHDLEHFIRTRHFFDPASRDTRHFQEELAEQIDDAVGATDAAASGDFGKAMDADGAVASLVSLSVDPMVRMRLRANPNDPIPLSPSKWREVKSEKDRCPHAVKGAITHGGPARILDVCTKKSCQKHFSVAKKKAAKKGKAAPAAKQENSWEAQQRRDREARAAWEQTQPAAAAALVAHLKNQKLTVTGFVKASASSYDLKHAKDTYGVAPIDEASSLLTLILMDFEDYSAEAFGAAAKRYDFDFKAWKKQHDAEQAKAGKEKFDAQREQLTGTKGAKKTAKKPAKKARPK
jgi:ParB/RepB/Spo0J family partition protein